MNVFGLGDDIQRNKNLQWNYFLIIKLGERRSHCSVYSKSCGSWWEDPSSKSNSHRSFFCFDSHVSSLCADISQWLHLLTVLIHSSKQWFWQSLCVLPSPTPWAETCFMIQSLRKTGDPIGMCCAHHILLCISHVSILSWVALSFYLQSGIIQAES